MPGIRIIGLIIAICFVLTGLLSVPLFAEPETGTANSAIPIYAPIDTGTTNAAISASGAAFGTTGPAINTTGTAITANGTAKFTAYKAITASGTALLSAGAAKASRGAAIYTTRAAITANGTAILIIRKDISIVSSALATTPKAISAIIDGESLWYRSQIPMKKEHQKILWDFCNLRKLDYIDMLALISLESNFDEKCSTGKYKGYFQIGTGHHANLAATLKTPNKPLDGAININWGTAFYSWILADVRCKGLEGKKLRDVALSIYQRGSAGYDRYGVNKSYLAIFYKKRDIIVTYFEKK